MADEGGYLIRPVDMRQFMDAVERFQAWQAQEEMRQRMSRFAPGALEVMARTAKGER